MSWSLKNIVTGEIMRDSKYSFRDLCTDIDHEIVYFMQSVITKGNKSRIKKGIKDLKKIGLTEFQISR